MLYLNYNNNLISFDLITILYNSILDIISLYIYIYIWNAYISCCNFILDYICYWNESKFLRQCNLKKKKKKRSKLTIYSTMGPPIANSD